MNVMIFATKNCSQSKKLSSELDNLDVRHHVVYCDDEPEIVEKYGIWHSPNLIVNGEVAFSRLPREGELKKLFNLYEI